MILIFTDRNNSSLKIAIVYNSFAGNGRASSLVVVLTKKLKARQIPFECMDVPWHQEFDSFSDVWIIGGDGTLNCFINSYPNISLPLTIFSGGTGNDFYSMLYANLGVEEVFEIGLGNDSLLVDAATCNEKIFLNGLGIGFEGMVTKDLFGKRKVLGKLTYWISIFRRLFFYKEKMYQVLIGEERIADRCLILDVMNGNRAGGGFKVAPGSSPFDGALLLVMVSKLSWYKRLFYVPIIKKGAHLNYPFVNSRNVTKISISSPSLMNAHIDGELHCASHFTISIKPAAYRFKYKKILSEN